MLDPRERLVEVSDARVALVVSTYHGSVTGRLERGARAALAEARVRIEGIETVQVPGAFEIPFAARRAAVTGRFDAVVCLGCLIRGETFHFEVLAAAVAQGVMMAAAETGVPMTFGVLTTTTMEEALERAGDGSSNKGWEAAAAAVQLIAVTRRLARRSRRSRPSHPAPRPHRGRRT